MRFAAASTLSCAVIIVTIVTLQSIVVECGSRQEQEILLLDALSRKNSQSSPSEQFEPNSIMDMLGRSMELEWAGAFAKNGIIMVKLCIFRSDTPNVQIQGPKV